MTTRFLRRCGLLPLLTAVLTACGGGGGAGAATPTPVAVTPTATPTPTPPVTTPSTWTLTWSDEFEGAAGSLPNPANWGYDLGNKEADGFGNHELQYYTAAPRNAQLDGTGQLIITAEKSATAGPCWNGAACAYTSARLLTKGKQTYTYGKVEARIKFPGGAGIWPAFWSLGEGAAWPNAGEIDIMEFVGKTPNSVYGTAHGPGYSGAQGIGKARDTATGWPNDFHVYTVIKRPNEIIWQVDGVEFHRLTPASLPTGASWVFERSYFIILNLAVGGDWPGAPDANTVFPAQMTVDWVRIYKEN